MPVRNCKKTHIRSNKTALHHMGCRIIWGVASYGPCIQWGVASYGVFVALGINKRPRNKRPRNGFKFFRSFVKKPRWIKLSSLLYKNRSIQLADTCFGTPPFLACVTERQRRRVITRNPSLRYTTALVRGAPISPIICIGLAAVRGM